MLNLDLKNTQQIILLGRLETCSFPEFGLLNVEAKIDTGAFTGCIHCVSIEERIQGKKKTLVVHFDKTTRKNTQIITHEFTKYTSIKVRSSSGKAEKRYKIKTLLKLGKIMLKTEFTLTNRSKMKYPVLIGRKILKENFLVDVSRSNIAGKRIYMNAEKRKRELKNNKTINKTV